MWLSAWAPLYGRRYGMTTAMVAWPLALVIVILLHAVGGFLALRLTFNNSPQVYYPADAPAIVLRDALRKDFPSDEVLTVLFHGDDLYTEDFLRRLQALSNELRDHPLVDRVTSILTVEKIAGSRDGFSVGPLIEPKAQKKAGPEDAKRRVLADRFVPGTLASRDGRYLAIGVRPKPLADSGQRLQVKIATVLAINRAGLRGHYAGDAGPVTMDVAQLESILRDTATFVPLTVGIGLALLWWVVGRIRPVVIGAVAMSTVVLPVVGAIAAFNQPYTMATAIIPTLLSAYTLATLMHLYAGIQRAQEAGLRRAERLDRAMQETLKPGIFNVLTTGSGLLSLVLVPVPPVQVFGVAGAAGTALVFIVVYGLMPPLLLRWDKHRWPTRRTSGMGLLGRFATRITIFSMRNAKTIIIAALVVLVAGIPAVRAVKVESDLLTFFPPSHPAVRHTQLAESKLMGVTSLEFSLRGQERDSLQNVERLRGIRAFQRWLEEQPEVDRTISMVDLIEEMHWAMNAEQAAFRTLPPTDRLLRQYLLVYDGTDLYELVNRDFQHARILANLHIHGAHEIGEVLARIRKRLEQQPIEGLAVDIGGQGRLFADQINLLVSGQTGSFIGAFVQIFLFMALLWRSFKAAAVCMVPNIAPLYFVFVLMGAIGIYLNMATVMIASIVLGITVDDTIHLYHGYKERLQQGISPVLAIARSFESSGRAVLAISVLLITQFTLLFGSDFIPTSDFGIMTALGLFSGQCFELLLLPPLLLLTDARRRAAPAAPHAPSEVLDAGDTLLAPRSTQMPVGGDTLMPVDGDAPMPLGGDTLMPPALPALVAAPAPPATAPPAPERVLVCTGDICTIADGELLWERFTRLQAARAAEAPEEDWRLTRTSCLGLCRLAPVVQLYPAGTYHGKLTPHAVSQLVEQRLLQRAHPAAIGEESTAARPATGDPPGRAST
ncbi:MMPL family transporter [Aquincola sp. S2]|uniref:MMPL family transporter n=1 Tax=Pseudaquabacterium terrae TaxID=2732868 RepID=A0ABX2EBH3_9BURK|nr:MMPL family transporter [Aquabacterium terrae]NRF66489.1 MMPL family transporter [Aquabacterium terrae]